MYRLYYPGLPFLFGIYIIFHYFSYSVVICEDEVVFRSGNPEVKAKSKKEVRERARILEENRMANLSEWTKLFHEESEKEQLRSSEIRTQEKHFAREKELTKERVLLGAYFFLFIVLIGLTAYTAHQPETAEMGRTPASIPIFRPVPIIPRPTAPVPSASAATLDQSRGHTGSDSRHTSMSTTYDGTSTNVVQNMDSNLPRRSSNRTMRYSDYSSVPFPDWLTPPGVSPLVSIPRVNLWRIPASSAMLHSDTDSAPEYEHPPTFEQAIVMAKVRTDVL